LFEENNKEEMEGINQKGNENGYRKERRERLIKNQWRIIIICISRHDEE
jgi:hypothetical protein